MHLYWSKTTDTYNEAISKAIRRDRFKKIMRYLHFNASDSHNKSDKFVKLRPLISHLQNRFMDNFVPQQNISHDEAMVEYFGRHSCKQAIRNKPIRFGYKIWCQNTIQGYLIAFDPYQGKSHLGDEQQAAALGPGDAAYTTWDYRGLRLQLRKKRRGVLSKLHHLYSPRFFLEGCRFFGRRTPVPLGVLAATVRGRYRGEPGSSFIHL